jgi:hypothetical protein
MKRFKMLSVLTLISFLCLSVTNLIAQDDETITGMIKGNDWDDDGNVIGAALVFDIEEEDEQGDIEILTTEYLIKDDDMGKQLYEFDGKTVEVIGVVSEDDEGVVFLKVKSFILVDKGNDEAEDEEPEDPQQ